MKRILRLFTLIMCLTFFVNDDIYSQKKSRKLIKADEAFNIEEYYKAAELYKKAYQKTENRALKAEIIFKQAECYRLSGDIKRSQSYYKRAIKAKYPDVIVYLRYGDVLRMQEDYEEAKEQYKKYIKLNPSDVNGEIGLKSCDFALKWKDTPTQYKIMLMPLVNSRNSDYSPTFGNGEYTEMYFTSSRKGGMTDDLDERTGEQFSDVYFTKVDKKGNWSRPIFLPEPINTKGNEGSVALNKRGTVMYLTQCKVEKKKELGCGIYVSKRKGKVWSEPQKLQIKVDEKTTIGHPAINSDESILIFSSDLEGGYGGKDLWIVTKEKRNTWSKPINLGPMVNTPGDEMFPFLHEDGSLYFSSNGHVGMGGLDIYKTSQNENGAYKLPINLKSPVNSAADDFSMVVESNGERGYLTSNRKGGKGGDDIYQFELLPIKLSVQGVVTDSESGSILTNSSVELKGNDSSNKKSNTDNTGSYSFKLEPLTSYQITASREGYISKTIKETTVGIDYDKVFIADISLEPDTVYQKQKIKEELEKELVTKVETFDGTLFIFPRVQFEFAKWSIKEEYMSGLDDLASMLIKNPDIVIEITGHTDNVGNEGQNKRLAKKRAKSCANYLKKKGVSKKQLKTLSKGESEPLVLDINLGALQIGDVLSEDFINKILGQEERARANQLNRRASFKVLEK